MNRIHLFEFEDLPWFPNTIRMGMLDYLSFFLRVIDFYKPSIPLIKQCLDKSENRQILDLCSGGGGPIVHISEHLKEQTGESISILLSDKFPNTDAFKRLSAIKKDELLYISKPVDAISIPENICGVRTMFSAFHHFRPEKAKMVLENAVEKKIPIAIFDGGDKNIFTLLGILLIHPILFLFCTPFFKPFRFSRLIFTYLIPVIPLCTIWDGLVSILRLYSPRDMLRLTEEIRSGRYIWEAGKKKHPLGFKMSFLIGYPKHGPKRSTNNLENISN